METMLAMLKADLGIVQTQIYDARLTQYLIAATDAIKQEGASVDPSSVLDAELIVMYAAWLWRRRDTMDGMPRMLRWMLNNRIMSERAVGASD